MSNQIVISSGAKVRSLEGVLTGTAGIVNSVPLGGANGVATLDSNGKVPLSQLPASVVTYLGTWNAATNTPTLANGTGDIGDLYICNVAGTVNFGAGPITFAVSDWVIYNGSEWQKSSGASGTVTSVAVTESGDALNITGSPITTAGTINIGFAGNSTQYINGEGNLTTFPTLTGYVPYTGATTDVDLGVHVLNAQALHVKGTAGAGHLGLKHQSTAATGSANESLIYANVDGDLAWQNDNLYLTTLSTHANTANRVYTFPDENGTMAMLEGTQTFTGAKTFSSGVTISSTGTQPLKIANYATSLTSTSGYTTIGTNAAGFQLLNGGGSGAQFFYAASPNAYYLPASNGTIALTSDIPSLSGYVPYTGATANLNLGGYQLFGGSLNVMGDGSTYGGVLNFKQYSSISGGGLDYTTIFAQQKYRMWFDFNQSAGVSKSFVLDVSGLTNSTPRQYYMPNADGTIALTSDIPSLTNYVTLNGNQTITGIKTFTNEQLFGNGMTLTGGYITYTSGSFNLTLNTNLLTANRNVFLQDKAGTIALTSDLTGGTVTSVGLSSATSGVTIGSSPITTSGTITLAIATASGSQQGLLSSTDWTTFNNKQNALTNPVTGTGTTNYLPKFTGASTIGNSIISENSNEISINVAYPTLIFNGSRDYALQSNDASGAFRILDNTAGLERFSIASTGAATFSSNVSINGETLTIGGTTNNAIINNIASVRVNIDCDNTGTGESFTIGHNQTAINDSNVLFRVQDNGNVGIGTSSPQRALEVVGTIRNTNPSGSNFSQIYNDATGAWYGTGAYPMMFETNGSERMRITSGGNVGIGNSDPQIKLHVVAGSGTGTTTAFCIERGSGYGATFFKQYYNSGSDWGLIVQSSTNADGVKLVQGATSWTSNSDERLKDIIEPITSATDKINTLRAVIGKYKTDDEDKRRLFLIAQDVQNVFPEAVDIDGTEDAYMGIRYSELVPVLVKAIQEQQVQIKELKALINK